jgi:hypothetical protein
MNQNLPPRRIKIIMQLQQTEINQIPPNQMIQRRMEPVVELNHEKY